MKLNALLRSPAILGWALIIPGVYSLAQQPDEPPAFTIQVDTNKVLIPVVVRDKRGHVISDLKREDFKVLDDDKLRAVSGFLVERHGQVEGSVGGNAQATPSSSPAALGPRTLASARFIVFLFDDMHLSFEDLAHAKAAGVRLLNGAFADSDMTAVIAMSGKVNTGLTQDRAKLQAAIASLQPHGGLYQTTSAECPSIGFYQADQIENKHDPVALAAATAQVFNCAPGMDRQRDQSLAERMAESAAMRALTLGHQDVQVTYASMENYVRRVAALPGQRTIILVSSGFLSLSAEEKTEESRLMDLAAESNVILSALDARGLYTTELNASERSPGAGRLVQLQAEYHRSTMTSNENVMAELADATGGTYFHNSNDLDTGLKALTAVPECIYVLELSLADVKQNGSYHRLKVKVDRDGVQLQARRGYFMPKPRKHK
jgi:VWFA-related protein